MPQPPAPTGKKKSSLGLVLGVGGGVLLVGIAVVGFLMFGGKKKRVLLPVDAKLMPGGTTEVATQLIEATRETDERVKNAYLAAELGAEMCKPGAPHYASFLERLGSRTPKDAREFFFDKKAVDQAREVLSCGGLLGGSLASPYQTMLAFEDGDGKKRRVGIAQEKLTGLPDSLGFAKQKFGASQGYCRTQDAQGNTTDCKADSHAMFIAEPNWFMGTRDSLDAMADAMKKPKDELTASVASLRDAAGELDGLPVVRLQAQPKSSKEFFMMPCTFGALSSSAPMKDFNDGCFPKGVDKAIEAIDAKLKAAGYEFDGDYVKAGAIHGSIVLVLRNADSAKEAEKDVKEIVTDWKSHVEDNETKLIRASREYPYDARTKRFAAIADNYFAALKAMKYQRNGRTIRLSFASQISPEDKAGLEEAEKSTADKRRAVAEIVEALRDKKAIPQKALSKLVGESWGKYLASPPLEGTAARVPLTPEQCADAVKKTTPMKITDFTTSDAKTFFIQLRYASCAKNPPQVLGWQRDCIARAVKAADLQVCAAMKPTNEPADSEYGDRALKK